MGRGVLWISAAKILFVALGFAVQFGLPRVLSGPEEFGLLSAAIAFTVILTNAMTTSMVQTTSKLVAEASADRIARALATRHAVLAALLASLVLGGAGLAATHLLSNPALTPLVRLASVVVIAYAVYATAIGALNGARAFERQARLDATFSVVRTLGMLGGGLAMGVALSAMTGFAAAASAMALIGLVTARLYEPATGRVPTLRAHLATLLPIAVYQLALNGLLQLDLTLLATGATLDASAAGLDATEAAAAGARATGLYRVAQTLSFVPYQLMTSVTLVIFPIVAQARQSGDDAATRQTVSDALRFSVLLVAGLLACLAGASEGAVSLAFPDTYRSASSVIPVLAASQLCFGMGVIHATVLIGRGHLWRTVGIVAASLGVAVAGNVLAWWLAPALHLELALSTALGTAAGSALFVTLTAIALRADLGVGVAPPVLARVALSAAVAIGVARVLPGHGKIAGLVALSAAAIAYLTVLVISGELGARERELVKRVLARLRR